MRYMYKFVGLIMLSLFFACSNDNHIIDDDLNVENNMHNKSVMVQTRALLDPLYNVLGYGYDISEDYASEDAVKFRVVDVRKMIETEVGNSLVDLTEKGIDNTTSRIFSGATYSEYTEDIKKSTGYKGSVASHGISEAAEKGLFSVNASYKRESESKYAYSTKYSFASVDALRTHRELTLRHNDISILKKYLDDFFKYKIDKNLSSPKDADLIIEEYGTHVMFKIKTGGYYRSIIRGAVTNESRSESKTRAVESAGKFTLSSVGLSIGKDWSTTETKTWKNKNLELNLYMNIFGGEQSGVSVTITENDQGTTNSITTSQTTWENSVKGSSARLVDLDWNFTYPIYDLIDDINKKQLLKDAIERYLANKKRDIIEIVPLIQWYNTKDKFYAYTCDPNYNYGSGWNRHGVMAYVYNKAQPNSAPLIQWHNTKERYHAYTCDPNYNYGNGWTRDGIIAYTPKKDVFSAVPLFQWYNSKDKCVAYTYEPNYNFGTGWNKQGAIGYVYPINEPL